MSEHRLSDEFKFGVYCIRTPAPFAVCVCVCVCVCGAHTILKFWVQRYYFFFNYARKNRTFFAKARFF